MTDPHASTGDSTPLLARSNIMTWPNLVTLIRLACIPVFVWLLFGRDNRAAAAWLLAALGSTDWVDGWLARRFDQATEFGAMFDPTVDRLLFLVAVPSMIVDKTVPIWLAIVFLAREAVVACMAVVVKIKAGEPLRVTWEGKTGTFLLMFAIPMFLGAGSTLSYAPVLRWLAWIFALPGLAYSLYSAGAQYWPATRKALTAGQTTPDDKSVDSPPSVDDL